ncbi:ABC transporter [Hydrococcus rivularis NIES-593]|uniref:ABC transporter n=1 Tax=Hydrococcus rivularis NIES-593 TaxID=1921803 RepID=A0A1U7HJN9_9CYAN|nr:ABC transporter permease DevC [Hydrococcus rivularis]OKH23802.1 ABC transporter [Hydrococcus rivularis NIES-593]
MKLQSLKNLLTQVSKEPLLGWAQLAHQKVRSCVAMAGIAFADILIFTQLGFNASLFNGVTRVHEHLKGDLFLQSNRAEFLADGQTFSRNQLYQANAVEGVKSASPFYYAYGKWVNPWDKKIVNVAIMAFNPARPVMDLPEVNQQLEKLKLPDTVLFDSQSQPDFGPVAETLAKGETVTTELSDRRVKVDGIFALGSTLFTEGHIVTSDWNYLRLFGEDSIDKVSVGIINLEPGADLQTVQRAIDARLPDDVKVMNREEFLQSEKAYWDKHPAGVIFNFGVAMGFIVGVVIVYQVLYSDVNDHLAEYATLKAMGYSDRQLLAVVFQEGTILAVLGFVPGFASSIGIYSLLGSLTRIPIAMGGVVASQVFALTILMCLISAAIAMRKLQSADPADVF